MENDLILVNPLEQFDTGNNFVEYLGFSYIASYLREKGYSIKILDMYLEGISLDECITILNVTDSRVIGFTSMSSLYIKNIKYILSRLDRRNRTFVVGGLYATQNYKQILIDLDNLDYVFLGEGEKTFNEFLNNLKHKLPLNGIKGLAYKQDGTIYSNGMREFFTPEEILNLPRPAHDTLEMSLKRNGIPQIAMSRGCYGNCSFCAISNYYKENLQCRWRGLDVFTCIDELEYLVNHYHVNYVDFCDEEFIGPHTSENSKRLQLFTDEIEKRNIVVKYMIYCRSNDVSEELFLRLKKSGLDRVFLGIEFGNNSLLRRYGKGTSVEMNVRAINLLKKLDIKLSVGYIMFEPFMDIKLLRDNMDFYFQYCPFKLDRLATKMGIFPNTKLYEEAKESLDLNHTVWDEILGDHYPYHFIDKRVEIGYQAMIALKGILSKSKSYYKIKTSSKNANEYEHNFDKWKRELHEKITQLINELTALDSNQLKGEQIVSDFIKSITIWDHTYLL